MDLITSHEIGGHFEARDITSTILLRIPVTRDLACVFFIQQIRRRRWLIFSPGLERSDNPGVGPLMYIPTLKGFAAKGTLSGLTAVFIHLIPELSLRSNSGLKLANAFGVFV